MKNTPIAIIILIVAVAISITIVVRNNSNTETRDTEETNSDEVEKDENKDLSIYAPDEEIFPIPTEITLGDTLQFTIQKESPTDPPFDAEEFTYLISQDCLENACWTTNRLGKSSWPNQIILDQQPGFKNTITVEFDTSLLGIIPEGTYHILSQTFFGSPSNVSKLDEMDSVTTTTQLVVKHPSAFPEGYLLAEDFGKQFGEYILKGILYSDDTSEYNEDTLSLYFEGETRVAGTLKFSDFYGDWCFHVNDNELIKIPFNGFYPLNELEKEPIQSICNNIDGTTSEEFEELAGEYPHNDVNAVVKIGNIRQLSIGVPAGGAGSPFADMEILETLIDNEVE